MKNFVVWSRDSDLKIVRLAGVAAALSLTGWVGSRLPNPFSEGAGLGLIGVLMAVPTAVFVWAIFGMIKPTYFTRNWRRWLVAELFIVPIVWGLLMFLFRIWLAQIRPYDPLSGMTVL